MSAPSPRSPLAVVGLSALFPGSSDASGFWRDILAGRDLIGDVPPGHWLVQDYYDPDPQAPDKVYVRRGAFLAPVEFDPLEHGIPPSILPATDTSQLLALIVAKRVLEDAAGSFERIPRERVSVILGATSAQELVSQMSARLQRPVWVKALREHGLPEDEVQAICERISGHYVPWQESTFPGLLGNVIAGRIANRLDLGGTNCVTDAACASSLAALQMAASLLWHGDSDLVITGGVETLNDIFMFTCFSKTPALSPTEDCRPFSADADGTMLGEGLGMLALRRLADAEKDGDRIYAVIRGIGSSSDGRAKSIYAPVATGQARALRRAYAAANYGPETVELIEAHGTGTRAGDAAEYEGLHAVFEASGRKERQWCALGSVKSQLGHTKSAAGVAGLFKAVMAVQHKLLPPTIKVSRPNPELRLEQGPFYLNTEARPWIRGSDHPRRASVSSFGFGGSNFHVTLEEYSGPAQPARRFRALPSELLLLSGPDPAALAQRCREVAREAARPGVLATLAWRSLAAYAPSDPVRLAVVAGGEPDLASKLERAAAAIASNPETGFDWPDDVHYATRAVGGRLALLFPGEGSQHVGMAAQLAMACDAARLVWDSAADHALWDGLRLADVVFPRPAFSEAEREACAAQLARPEWAQPAIAVAGAAAAAVLRALGLSPACVAGEGLGEVTALFAAGALELSGLLRIARARGELLAESAPRGDAVLSLVPATPAFARLLEGVELAAPAVPVIGAPGDADGVRARLVEQLVKPLRCADLVEELYGSGVRLFVEVGPGAGLSRVVASCLAGREHVAVSLDRRGQHGVTALWSALARLAAAGVAFDLRPLWQAHLPLPEAAPRKAAHAVPISGTNYAKPYPPPGGAAALPGPNPPRPLATPPPAASVPSGTVELLPPPPALEPTPVPEDAWGAFQAIQHETAQSHAAYQRATAEVHLEYLRSAETSLLALLGMPGQSPHAAPSLVAPAPPMPAPLPRPPALETAPAPPPPATLAPPPAAAPLPPTPALPAPTPAAAAGPDVKALLLTVVAEKTGYPVEMLTLEMHIEADLGIDSIKRVEILSAMQERAAGLPVVKAADLAALKTLGQIVEFLEGDARAPRAAAG
jgi:acyl transferase domain-containing protein/acyl carrier protein